MTVKQLRDFLASFPDEMEILETRNSDLGPMEMDSWNTIQGIEQVSGTFGWVQRANRMTAEHQARVKTYLHYAGN